MTRKKTKVYEYHEIAYRKMKENGLRFWNQIQSGERKAIDPDTRRFLNDVLAQPWSPKKGKVIELGCGTSPILNWMCKKNFSGLGVDISKTAITMAKEQSASKNIRFKQVDICDLAKLNIGKFDLVIDGHCLHCITNKTDRNTCLKNVHNLLNKDGIFVVMTMCSPVDQKVFAKACLGQKLLNQCIYVPSGKTAEIEGIRTIKGKIWMPTRKVMHWKKILSEISQAGLKIELFRYDAPHSQDPFSSIFIAASK